MSSDETYLESFLDSLSGLPHEIKRNLELMKDLDKSCSSIQEEMRQLQSSYIQQGQEKVMSLEVVAPPTSSSDQNGTQQPPPPGVRVLGGGNQVIIPTTEEMMRLISNPTMLEKIRSLQDSALQQADQKVSIADQTHSLVENIVKRLDEDLQSMETMLQSTGEFTTIGAAQPDDLAAIQPTVGSSDWILAKVITHDPQTGMYKLSDEDVESNKIFHLPESQVVVLHPIEKLSRGEIVFAVYPDTTAFYQATVVQPPRKMGATGGGSGGAGNAASGAAQTFVMVHFVDDSDEHGITHDKAVPLQHVMMPPYGAQIQ